MAEFKSRVLRNSDQFKQNREDMLELVDQLRTLENKAVEASDKRRAVFENRGQLTPRERLSRLLDPGMPFLQLFSLANYLVEDTNPETSIPGGSVILGIGFVSGVRCMIWVDDSGIRAGAATTGGWRACTSAQEMALKFKLPFIHLVESAGANLMDYKVEGWAYGGMLFRNLAKLSASGIPVITVLHGPSTAGGAYMPGMSDYVIGVKENGMMALAGAALVHAATGEVANDRELGGTEMHASTTGSVEYLADDDAHGISIARDVVKRLHWNKRLAPIYRQTYDQPLLSIEDIAGIVPKDYTIPYDVREVIARIVDGSSFEDVKPGYGASTVCTRASIMGFSCALIGNNGPIDPNGATKVAHFLQLCEQSQTPVIFLNNTTGYLVGTDYEQSGMIKHGAKMIQAVSTITVPKISLYIGASYGAGNYGMCGYGYEPDFLFAWPNASTGVMSGGSAARTMGQVMEVRAKRKGQEPDSAAIAKQEQTIMDIFSAQENAFYTSGRVLDNGVIDPRDTRKVIGFALETILESKNRKVSPNSFAVARM